MASWGPSFKDVPSSCSISKVERRGDSSAFGSGRSSSCSEVCAFLCLELMPFTLFLPTGNSSTFPASSSAPTSLACAEKSPSWFSSPRSRPSAVSSGATTSVGSICSVSCSCFDHIPGSSGSWMIVGAPRSPLVSNSSEIPSECG